MSNAPEWDKRAIIDIVQSLFHKKGALLPILHAIQGSQGYIPKASVPIIAKALNQTVAEVHGVISFYEDFRTSPVGQNVIQICRAEACQARGSRQLEQHVKTSLKIDYHHTTPDKEFTLLPVYCLGNCACGPSIRVNDDIIAEVSPQKFDTIADMLTTYIVELK
jgi:formate dehydrogenase subunit gamma